MALKNSVSGLGLHAQGKKSLSDILAEGKIPSDLSNYDMLSQQVLLPYRVGASVLGIYITSSGAGKQDGSSWENAYSSDKVESALDNVSDANINKVYLILMGAGTYAPSHDLAMKNYVGIVGGFPLAGGWARKATDITTFNGNNAHGLFQNSDIDYSALLYGVSIINGNETSGGGMHNWNASPTITNVIFANNSADIVGGGISDENISSPILTNVLFFNNTANDPQNGEGGGMANDHSCSPILTNVVFENNRANYDQYGEGGGMANDHSCSPILTNVIFIGNSAEQGGGVCNKNNSCPTFLNTVFLNNKANYQFGGGLDSWFFPSLCVNTIFWGNTPRQYIDNNGNILYSVVQGDGKDNPMINDSLTYAQGYFMPTIMYGGTSPDNIGVYVKQARTSSTLYYSSDGIKWYQNPSLSGSTVTPPADAIDLTGMDIQGHPRIGRPDAGVWAKHS